MLKQQLEQDLKKALLAGEKDRATVLRGLKSVILYAEVAAGSRDSGGVTDDEITALFAKEAKKRQESADIYQKAGSLERVQAELSEKAIIEEYLPEQLSDEALVAIVDEVIASAGLSGAQAMGQTISLVKQKAGSSADGGRIARLVKERL